MKKITLFSLLILTSLQLWAQNFVTTTVWKAEARSGGTFIGVAEDEFDAENIIDELSFEKQGTKYEIVGKEIAQIQVNIHEKESVFDDFKSDSEDMPYKYITEIEMISLEYIEDDNLNMAVSFYKNASSVKCKSIVKEHLTELHQNFSKYIFNANEGATLVGYSE